MDSLIDLLGHRRRTYVASTDDRLAAAPAYIQLDQRVVVVGGELGNQLPSVRCRAWREAGRIDQPFDDRGPYDLSVVTSIARSWGRSANRWASHTIVRPSGRIKVAYVASGNSSPVARRRYSASCRSVTMGSRSTSRQPASNLASTYSPHTTQVVFRVSGRMIGS